MTELLNRIHDIGIVPVIAIDDADKAVDLVRALVKGGLPVAEVTFRTEAAEEAIRAIVREVPTMIVGAGTVLTKRCKILPCGAEWRSSQAQSPGRSLQDT